MYATVFVFGLVMVAVPAVRRLQAEAPITPDRKQACSANYRPLGYKIVAGRCWHTGCLHGKRIASKVLAQGRHTSDTPKVMQDPPKVELPAWLSLREASAVLGCS